MVSISSKPIREGNFTNWLSRAVLTMGNNVNSKDYITFYVDSIYDILYVFYNVGWPSWDAHVATYQLPGCTLIEDNMRVGGPAFIERASSGHLQNIQIADTATCSTNANYVMFSGPDESHFYIYRKGTLLATVASSFNMYSLYISADAHYVVLGEEASPHRIEVFEGV